MNDIKRLDAELKQRIDFAVRDIYLEASKTGQIHGVEAAVTQRIKEEFANAAARHLSTFKFSTYRDERSKSKVIAIEISEFK